MHKTAKINIIIKHAKTAFRETQMFFIKIFKKINLKLFY